MKCQICKSPKPIDDTPVCKHWITYSVCCNCELLLLANTLLRRSLDVIPPIKENEEVNDYLDYQIKEYIKELQLKANYKLN